MAFLKEEASFYGQLILGTPEVSGNPWDLLPAIQPTPKTEAIQCAVCQVMFDGTSNGIQLGSGQLFMLDVLCYGCVEGFFLGGEAT